MKLEHDVDEFDRRGFAVCPEFVERQALPDLRKEADRLLAESSERGGARNALQRSKVFCQLAYSRELLDSLSSFFGTGLQPVKLTVFDKTERANWKVPNGLAWSAVD